jgi:hypothetical protein
MFGQFSKVQRKVRSEKDAGDSLTDPQSKIEN